MLVLFRSYSKCSFWIATININSPSKTYIPFAITGFQDEMMGTVECSPLPTHIMQNCGAALWPTYTTECFPSFPII